MSGNFSSNHSVLQPPDSFQVFSMSLCFVSKSTSDLFLAYAGVYAILLLPLCSFILHHGVQQWRKRSSSSSSSVTMSHSDVFIYHIAIVGLFCVLGSILFFCGVCRNDFLVLRVGHSLVSAAWYGETLFHVLTCVERYLAVVHPITYLSLRTGRGARIRNVSIVCVWLTFVLAAYVKFSEAVAVYVSFAVFSTCLTVVFFCSVSALCVLIRPGPGNQGRAKERRDQSKQKAFYIIVSVLVALGLRFSVTLAWGFMYILQDPHLCLRLGWPLWFNLPSSMVLPLLFLHREGKLFRSKANVQRVIRAVFTK